MAQTRRMGAQNGRAKLPKAPRPPSQASTRPSLEVMHARKRGRDVGLAESGSPYRDGHNERNDGAPRA
jgi:hypothetical protein